jgi:hypothetical protein
VLILVSGFFVEFFVFARLFTLSPKTTVKKQQEFKEVTCFFVGKHFKQRPTVQQGRKLRVCSERSARAASSRNTEKSRISPKFSLLKFDGRKRRSGIQNYKGVAFDCFTPFEEAP